MQLTTRRTLTGQTTHKYFLVSDKESFFEERFKDKNNKRAFIRDSAKEIFESFIIKMPRIFVNIFDDEGFEFLKYAYNADDKLKIVIIHANDSLHGFLDSETCCYLIFKYLHSLSEAFICFDYESSKKFINYLQKNNLPCIEYFFEMIPASVQKELLVKMNFDTATTKKLLLHSKKPSSEYLLYNDFRIADLNDYAFFDLFTIFSKDCRIPSFHYENRELKTKISTMDSVKDYRFLINALARNNDTSSIERARKRYYDLQFATFNSKFKMLDRYYQCYLELCDLIDEVGYNIDKLDDIFRRYFNFFGSGTNESHLKNKISYWYQKSDKKRLRIFLAEESRLQVSNMIIDYHFEDVPYNFFLDVYQLCKFQTGEGRTLSDEYLAIYRDLLSLDDTTFEDQMKLHNRLKKENFMAKHYDLFREAKNKCSMLMLDKMLTKDNIIGFLDEYLSLEHNVPIYVLDGQEFYAFVKSTERSKYRALKFDDLEFTVDGASYSLDGSGKLDTYRDPRIYFNLVFSDFPISQVVHMYPVDSFSKYERGSSNVATHRVYELLTPKQFVEKSRNYNEIILAQPNELNPDDALNAYLSKPTLLGIYCYDEITEYDIASAKNLGVGIVLVKTKKYHINKNGRLSTEETIAGEFNRNYLNGIDYFEYVGDDDMVTRRMM